MPNPKEERAPRRSQKLFYVDTHTGQSTCRRSLLNFNEVDHRFWDTPKDFSHLNTMLRFEVPRKGLPRDIDTVVGRVWVVSDRAKAFLLEVCPGDVDFPPVETSFAHQGNFGDYWVCITRTYLDALDEARSDARVEIGQDGRRWHSMVGSPSAVFKLDVVGDHHLFRLSTCTYCLFCTDTFRSAFKRAKLTGQSFLPAEEPRYQAIAFIKTVVAFGQNVYGEIVPDGGGPNILYTRHSLPTQNFEPRVGQRVEVSARIQNRGGRVADTFRVI